MIQRESNFENLPGGWKCEPENEGKFEGIVKWEPVNSVDSTFKYCQKGKHHPIL